MDGLKISLDTKGRKMHNLTKVQRFYSEFNSDLSRSPSSSSSENGTNIFSFERKSSQYHDVNKTHERSRHKHPEIKLVVDVDTVVQSHTNQLHKNDTIGNYVHFIPQKSPGLSSNQDFKDKALELIYQKKIKELKSKLTTTLCIM